MNKLLVQLVLVISCIVLLSGCNKRGSLPEESSIVFTGSEGKTETYFGPLPTGLPTFVEIVEPYLGTSSTIEGATSLFSYKSQETASGTATRTEVISAQSDLIISLNTNTVSLDDSQEDTLGNEFTLIVKNDSVYLVNHVSNEIRLLSHFTTPVCEILPVDVVKGSAIVHDERVYVVTADDGLRNNNACNVDSKKRYYELPLDHQLETSVDDDSEINTLILVKESLARSKIIFGWIPDENNPGQEIESYGYLGYDGEDQYLSFYDQERNLKWSQKRELQEFDIVDLGQGQSSSKFMVNINQLDNLFYLVQLGLDVFVVDSGKELLSKVQSEVDSILTDKVATISATVESGNTYAMPAEFDFDEQNLFIFDDYKIYHLLYQADVPARDPSQFKGHNPTDFAGKKHLVDINVNSFSQFDLKTCEDGDIACLAANDVQAQNWQFFTPCEAEFGCTVPINVNDFCETLAEKLQTQSNQTLCTPSDYQHISELNNVANDAELIAYMQYADYIRSFHYNLAGERLFITAKMDRKDVFLAYNFKMDFGQPKSLREHVYFGKQASLFGMTSYLYNSNLYLTALQESSIRSNECYKKGIRVTCNLGNLEEQGTLASCTGKDLADGLCTNQYKEYESKAFFCSAEKLDDLSCSDANLSQLDDLAVEDSEEDGKWLSLFNYTDGSYGMYLLAGNHRLALDNNKLDEGKLYSPSLYVFDPISGLKATPIPMATLEGSVELVVGGWESSKPELGVFGHINVISEEIKQDSSSSINNESILATYLLEQTFENSSSVTSDFIKAPKVAERSF